MGARGDPRRRRPPPPPRLAAVLAALITLAAAAADGPADVGDASCAALAANFDDPSATSSSPHFFFFAGEDDGSSISEDLDFVTIADPSVIEAHVRAAVRRNREETGSSPILPGSPIHRRAEAHAKRRWAYAETPTQFQKREIIMASLRASASAAKGALSAADDDDDDEEILGVSSSSSPTFSSPLVAASESLGDAIAAGAVAATGALDPAVGEASPRSSVTVLHIPWLAALAALEHEQHTQRRGERRIEEGEGIGIGGADTTTARYARLLAWVREGGGWVDPRVRLPASLRPGAGLSLRKSHLEAGDARSNGAVRDQVEQRRLQFEVDLI